METSGLTVLVSEACDSFVQQLADAVVILKSNRPELRRLHATAGLDGLSLDFGVTATNGFLENYFFPSELISLAAEYAMSLQVSIYAS